MRERNDDIILLSKQLKNTILKKCEALGVTIYEVANYFGDDPNDIKYKYIQRRSPKESKEVHQGTILKYCKFLGINVTFVVQSGLQSAKKGNIPDKIKENVNLIKQQRIDKQRIKYGRKDT